jgi:hypothetical protein
LEAFCHREAPAEVLLTSPAEDAAIDGALRTILRKPLDALYETPPAGICSSKVNGLNWF